MRESAIVTLSSTKKEIEEKPDLKQQSFNPNKNTYMDLFVTLVTWNHL